MWRAIEPRKPLRHPPQHRARPTVQPRRWVCSNSVRTPCVRQAMGTEMQALGQHPLDVDDGVSFLAMPIWATSSLATLLLANLPLSPWGWKIDG